MPFLLMEEFEAADRIVPLSINEADNYRRQLNPPTPP